MEPEVAYVGAPLDGEVEGVLQVPILRIMFNDLSNIRILDGPIVFTSKRGIASLRVSNVSIESPRIYCIGERTSEFLKRVYSLDCAVPDIQSTDGLAELLIGKEDYVTVVGSDKVSKNFLERLKSSGVEMKLITAYSIEGNENIDYDTLRNVRRILFGSSKSFEILHKNAERVLSGKELYAIGRPTSETMLHLGYKPVETFESPNIERILTGMLTKR